MIYHLDTDSFTLAYYKKSGVAERIEKERLTDTVEVPMITRLEVLQGRISSILKVADAEQLVSAIDRLRRSEEFLAEFDLAPLSDKAGVFFGRFHAEKKYRKIGRADLLIACIALAHNATLVTRNTKDFAVVPGLKLENWAD